jgi:ketosteroid isomerase-like protein
MRLASVLSIIIVSLVTPAFADDADVKKQADQITAAYVEHWNKQDAAGLVGLWAADAIYVNIVSGPTKPTTETYQGMFKAGLDHLESSVDQVVSLGPNAALGTGKFHFTGKNPSGAAVDTQGYFTAAYVKDGEKWKLKMLMGAAKPAPAK